MHIGLKPLGEKLLKLNQSFAILVKVADSVVECAFFVKMKVWQISLTADRGICKGEISLCPFFARKIDGIAYGVIS